MAAEDGGIIGSSFLSICCDGICKFEVFWASWPSDIRWILECCFTHFHVCFTTVHHCKFFCSNIYLCCFQSVIYILLILLHVCQNLVIKTRSVEYMPFYLSLSTFLMSLSFFAYGVFKRDPFICVSSPPPGQSFLITLIWFLLI